MNASSFDPAAEPYVSLATYRRDGREVRTAVWLAELDGRYYCFSAGQAGKVKRVRANGQARLAPCDVRGRVHGEWLDATARLVTDDSRKRDVYAALRRKYGWQMWIGDVFARLTGRYARRAVLELDLSERDDAPGEARE